MQAFTTDGIIITQTVHIHNYETEHPYLLYIKNCDYSVIKLSHVNSNANWVTEDGKELINKEHVLYVLYVITNSGIYTIAYKDWPIILKNNWIGIRQMFNIIPKKFKPGKNVQTCSECHCTFLAAKFQPYCKNCCYKFSIAYLIDNLKTNTEEKVYNRKFVEKIANLSYDMGSAKLSIESHTKWLKEELDGNNTD